MVVAARGEWIVGDSKRVLVEAVGVTAENCCHGDRVGGRPLAAQVQSVCSGFRVWETGIRKWSPRISVGQGLPRPCAGRAVTGPDDLAEWSVAGLTASGFGSVVCAVRPKARSIADDNLDELGMAGVGGRRFRGRAFGAPGREYTSTGLGGDRRR